MPRSRFTFMLDRLVDGMFRLRWLWIGLGAMAFLAAAFGASQLRFDYTPQLIFRSSDDSYRQLERLYATLGRQDSSFAALIEAPDVLAEDVLELQVELAERLAELDGIEAVRGLGNAFYFPPGSLIPAPMIATVPAEELAAVVDQQPLLIGRMISRDHQAAVVLARVESEQMEFERLEPIVAAAEALIDEMPRPPGVEIALTGIPVVRAVMIRRLQIDQMIYVGICFSALLVLMWFFFRDLRTMAAPLAAAGGAMFLLMGSLGGFGESINVLNNVFPTLILVIGVSDGIHLVSRYREELARGVPRDRAMRRTVRHLATACFLTSFTTAIGFASLGTARIDILRSFGLWAAFGILVAYLVTIIGLPLGLQLFPPKLGSRARITDRRIRRFSTRIASLALAYPRAILVGAAGVAVFAVGIGLQVDTEIHLHEAFPDEDPIVVANRIMEEHFTGPLPFSLVVEWDEGTEVLRPSFLSYLLELGSTTSELGQAATTLSVADMIAEWNRVRSGGSAESYRIPETVADCRLALQTIEAAMRTTGDLPLLQGLFNEEARMLRVQAWVGDQGVAKFDRLFSGLEQRLIQDHDQLAVWGVRAYLNGDSYIAHDSLGRLIDDLFHSLLLAFVVIFFVMVVLLRSVKLALISMIPNALPLLITLGVMGLLGMPMRLTSVLVFTISLGLAVDDTIHFLARFKEEWARHGEYRPALRHTTRGAGTGILVTSCVLGIGLAAILFSQFPPMRTFALCMEVTIFSALLADLLVLPACLLLFQPFRPRATQSAAGAGL